MIKRKYHASDSFSHNSNAIEKEESRFVIEDGVLEKYIFKGVMEQGVVVIPRCVKKIRKGALSAGANHIEVVIPESVEHIDEEAFRFVKYVDIYGTPGSYAHQYAKKRKHGLTVFDFYSNCFTELPEPVKNEELSLKYDETIKNSLLWDVEGKVRAERTSFPKKLFNVNISESCSSDGNVSSCRTAVMMIDDGKPALEKTNIRYSAHNMAHCSTPFITDTNISFEDVQNYIKISKDEKAKNYIGMNEHNWNTYFNKVYSTRKPSKYPVVQFGKYYKYRDSNEMYPINWYILENTEKSLLLLARDGLDAYPWHNVNVFYEKYVPQWKTCHLNNWLNSVFKNTAFSAKEQKAILENERYNPIFCLSRQEAEKYLANDSSAKLRATDWAYARHTNRNNTLLAENAKSVEYEENVGYCSWWHRNSTETPINMFKEYPHISRAGWGGVSGCDMPHKINFARPVMWVEKRYFKKRKLI